MSDTKTTETAICSDCQSTTTASPIAPPHMDQCDASCGQVAAWSVTGGRAGCATCCPEGQPEHADLSCTDCKDMTMNFVRNGDL